MHDLSTTIRASVRDGVARAVTAVGLAGIGVIHLLDLPGTMSATPYLGWLYIALIASSLVAAFALVRGSHRLAWGAAAALAAGAMVGYTLSRTVGLPSSTDDIGNWSEPLGMASLFVEGLVVAVSVAVLGERRTAPAPAAESLQAVGARRRGAAVAG